MLSASRLKTPGFIAYLATQFAGAFNDNLFKLLLICFASNLLAGTGHDKIYVPIAGALFILPFLLCSSYAGYLADRFSKKQVMVGTKVAEIVIMLCGLLLFRLQTVNLLLLVLFCMGAQSTFFSPAKYGFLPETLPAAELSRGNGLNQLFTFLAIILEAGPGVPCPPGAAANPIWRPSGASSSPSLAPCSALPSPQLHLAIPKPVSGWIRLPPTGTPSGK